jgi:hypothetical protein
MAPAHCLRHVPLEATETPNGRALRRMLAGIKHNLSRQDQHRADAAEHELAAARVAYRQAAKADARRLDYLQRQLADALAGGADEESKIVKLLRGHIKAIATVIAASEAARHARWLRSTPPGKRGASTLRGVDISQMMQRLLWAYEQAGLKPPSANFCAERIVDGLSWCGIKATKAAIIKALSRQKRGQNQR